MLEWRRLVWLPNYEISERGDVRRLFSAGPHPAGRWLKGYRNREGYVCYLLTYSGVRREWRGHQLVCEAWHGPRPSKEHQVAHGDGDPAHNHFTNLRWATSLENHQDQARHGRKPIGERVGNAKLTWVAVKEIRASALGVRGEVGAFARRFGVHPDTVRDVLNGRTWTSDGEINLSQDRAA